MNEQSIDISLCDQNKGQIPGVNENPMTIAEEDFAALKKSMVDEPDFFKHQPIMVFPFEGRYVALCGNQRLRAAKELDYKQVPCDVLAPDTPTEKLNKYVLLDNFRAGKFDQAKLLQGWDRDYLEGLGLVTVDVLAADKPKGFAAEVAAITDEQAEMPIVPDFFECHECFVIPCHNQIDEGFIRDLFGLDRNFKSNSGDKKVRRTNVIDVETIRKAMK